MKDFSVYFSLNKYVSFQVTFYEAMKDLSVYGKRKYLLNSDLEVSNSFEGLVLGGLAGGMFILG
jgi:hypothetical protein